MSLQKDVNERPSAQTGGRRRSIYTYAGTGGALIYGAGLAAIAVGAMSVSAALTILGGPADELPKITYWTGVSITIFAIMLLLLGMSTVAHRVRRDGYIYNYPLQMIEAHQDDGRFKHDPRFSKRQLEQVFEEQLAIMTYALETQTAMRVRVFEDVLRWGRWMSGLAPFVAVLALISALPVMFTGSYLVILLGLCCNGLLAIMVWEANKWFQSHFIAEWERRERAYEELNPRKELADYVSKQQSTAQLRDRLLFKGFKAAMNSKGGRLIQDFFKDADNDD